MESIDALVAGTPYFFLFYSDEACSIPVIQTLIFERLAKSDDGIPLMIFRYVSAGEVDREWFVPADQFDIIKSYSELREELGRISVRVEIPR
jgi:hypothetical protein